MEDGCLTVSNIAASAASAESYGDYRRTTVYNRMRGKPTGCGPADILIVFVRKNRAYRGKFLLLPSCCDSILAIVRL